jgi:hypothetical protein
MLNVRRCGETPQIVFDLAGRVGDMEVEAAPVMQAPVGCDRGKYFKLESLGVNVPT